MFYQIREGDKVIGRHKSIRQAYAAAAEDPEHRTIVAVKYQGTVLNVVREYTKEELQEEFRKLSLVKFVPGG